jgi:hypothetical protein
MKVYENGAHTRGVPKAPWPQVRSLTLASHEEAVARPRTGADSCSNKAEWCRAYPRSIPGVQAACAPYSFSTCALRSTRADPWPVRLLSPARNKVVELRRTRCAFSPAPCPWCQPPMRRGGLSASPRRWSYREPSDARFPHSLRRPGAGRSTKSTSRS